MQEPWNAGTLEPWNSGLLTLDPGTLQEPGTLEPWNAGTNLGTWNPGTLQEPWNLPGTLEISGTLEPWNFETSGIWKFLEPWRWGKTREHGKHQVILNN